MRGVDVRVILDQSQESAPYSLLPELLAFGFTSFGSADDTLRVDDKHAIHHNKVMIRDGGFPDMAAHENGSFNFSEAAQTSNAENAQVTEGFPEATGFLLDDWRRHWAHSRPVRLRRK